MSLVQGLLARGLVLALSCLFGVGAVIRTLVRAFKMGPGILNPMRSPKRTTPPACLMDEALGQHGYVHLEDIRMHYVSNGAEGKPLMLLLHGFPEFWYSWRHQLKEFSDYRVVALDLRGYGETDKPSGISNYSMKFLVEDVKQFIYALGYKRCVLVGHDWGGAISWSLAARYPNLVSHLIVLNCPDFKSFRQHLTTSLAQFKRSWYMFLFQLPWLPEIMLRMEDFRQLGTMFKGPRMGVKHPQYITDSDLEAYKYNYSRNSFTGPVNYIRAAFSLDTLKRTPKSSQSEGRRDGSKGVTMPTLIVWGEDDGALDKPLAAMASQRCEGKVTVKYIENCSHWVQMDQPDLVNRYIREFLSQE